MTGPHTTFQEWSAQPRIERVPLSHVSIELGHLYREDFAGGIELLRRHFREIKPWVAAARDRAAALAGPGRRPRISTCFLIDDYFSAFSTPDEVIGRLVEAAGDNGLTIDYVAREAGCAEAGPVRPAELVLDRLVNEPPPGTDGLKPPAAASGWVTNGDRPPGSSAQPAMARRPAWQPPTENAKSLHSIYLAVEIFSRKPEGRQWSCPFLAAVWQLLRLGMLRDNGRPVAAPQPAGERLPATWESMPAVLRLNPDAQPFSAYRTLSVLARQFQNIEAAVGVVLGQVAVDEEVHQQVRIRAEEEGVVLPEGLVQRISYVFDGDSNRVP
ncbi:SCO2522 family protein [Actinoplanes sichuanensis]|uniref:SCO2522 family protein n=1 Tax=Actinoplanes sichuanensis TaxID=512349 RepID=A0ABW4A904_9ACTN|nr:SCO2522 family protein [Actinoplanes sichuanensis]BEL09079.1 SCO2522 family protein [Actinoplanes sichuanensis]